MSALFQTYPPFPFELDRGQGDQVFAADGRHWFDFYGGHCVASTGHSHPRVVEAIATQAARLLFYSTAGEMRLRHEAADGLLEFAAGAGVSKVFFCNSGAEANENALKIAHKLTGRKQLLAVQGGWHGRMLACLGVTDDPPLTTPLQAWLPACTRLPFNDVGALAAIDWSQYAALIIEPIQSMSGIRVCSREWLAEAARLAKTHGTLLIFDEIQTGVGRLGAPFAAHHFGIQPDMLSSAKGLASGVPIGALLMSADVAAALSSKDLGSTFGGGPLACAALLATLAVIRDEQLVARAAALGELLKKQLTVATTINAVRGQGLLLGLETESAVALKNHLYAQQILLGGSSDPRVLRLMPPLNLSDAAVAALISACRDFATTASCKSPTGEA